MAIIPARSGSKGVSGKNIKLLGGHPLIAWSIAAAKLSQAITKVVVSTDSQEYATIASHYGAETPFLRPAEFSTDSSLDIDFLLHALGWLKEHENYFPDFLVHLRPTNPLRDPQVLDQAIGLITGRPEASSVISVYPVNYPPCKYLKKDNGGYLICYMDGVDINMPRQHCTQAYRSNGYVDVLRSSAVLATGTQLGARILPLITVDPGDIDSEDELQVTEKKMNEVACALKDYLDIKGVFTG
ncbi:MAG: acylneuraminate cytidylyltransferase family protein [Deltaproteobacteria bacterium]|jgi:N-acylneuraminate cytidylyltransferase|nr:acylneuraminate cytidylyltransferase family protein [Deltaproteobacteria bacterium]